MPLLQRVEKRIATKSTILCVTGKYVAEVKHSLFVRKYVSCFIHNLLSCQRNEVFFSHKNLGTKVEDVIYDSLEGMIQCFKLAAHFSSEINLCTKSSFEILFQFPKVGALNPC
jgi:hypothetical protein